MTTSEITSDTFEVFGTSAVLLVTRPRAIGQARSIADRLLADVDLACSRFRPDSELSRLNAAGGEPTQISATFADLLAVALRAARLTGGDVDPTCGRALAGLGYDRDFADMRAAGDAPPRLTGPVGPVPGWTRVRLDRGGRRVRLEHGAQLDLGATAKARAADKCAEQIADRLDCGVLVSLGGDVAVAGQPPPDGWQIRVTDDHAAPEWAPGQTVTISSGGLATSSTTVRTWTLGGRTVHHIIDPSTGEPARSCWRTVSVAAGTCTDANTASTAAIVRGAAALDWLHATGLPARLVRHDGTVETTAGWPYDDPGDAA
ncbi:MAG TPA: FAD:protein FMN transferase [Streptosporangiaceae bacterium]|nr:FAD:protein FMN transferase [Streptosporangiaceae bacterium]